VVDSGVSAKTRISPLRAEGAQFRVPLGALQERTLRTFPVIGIRGRCTRRGCIGHGGHRSERRGQCQRERCVTMPRRYLQHLMSYRMNARPEGLFEPWI
jgi:hypothetical protein